MSFPEGLNLKKFTESVHRTLVVTGLPWIGPETQAEFQVPPDKGLVTAKDVTSIVRDEFKQVNSAKLVTLRRIEIEIEDGSEVLMGTPKVTQSEGH
jgi:hypothetical protein